MLSFAVFILTSGAMLKRCDDENVTKTKPSRVVGVGGDDRSRASFVETGEAAAVPAWTQDIIAAVKSATGWGKRVAGLSLQATAEDKVEMVQDLEGAMDTQLQKEVRQLEGALESQLAAEVRELEDVLEDRLEAEVAEIEESMKDEIEAEAEETEAILAQRLEKEVKDPVLRRGLRAAVHTALRTEVAQAERELEQELDLEVQELESALEAQLEAEVQELAEDAEAQLEGEVAALEDAVDARLEDELGVDHAKVHHASHASFIEREAKPRLRTHILPSVLPFMDETAPATRLRGARR